MTEQPDGGIPVRRDLRSPESPATAGDGVPTQDRVTAEDRAPVPDGAPTQDRGPIHDRAPDPDGVPTPDRAPVQDRVPVPGELTWEETETVSTEWVPHLQPDAESPRGTSGRALAATSLLCGMLGLVGGVFGVWGAPLSLAAVIMALGARPRSGQARTLWGYGLASGLVGLALALLWVLLITGTVSMPGA